MPRTVDDERVRRYFDAHAGNYDRQMDGLERRLLGRHREWAVSRARGSVLELGVGTGLNLPLYPPTVTRILGLDVSEAMLARARIRASDLDQRASVRLGDALHLDLPAESVDSVVSTYTLCSMSDPGAALGEAARVLRPGGRLLLVEHGLGGSRWMRAVERLLDPLAVRLQSDHLLLQPVELVRSAAFEIVEAEQVGLAGIVHRVHARKPAADS